MQAASLHPQVAGCGEQALIHGAGLPGTLSPRVHPQARSHSFLLSHLPPYSVSPRDLNPTWIITLKPSIPSVESIILLLSGKQERHQVKRLKFLVRKERLVNVSKGRGPTLKVLQ